MKAGANTLPRPGIALGHYPELDGDPVSSLDTFVRGKITGLSTRWQSRGTGFRGVVDGVKTASEPLARMSEQELLKAVTALRQQLCAVGFRHDLTLQSFAMIQEVACRSLGMRHFDTQIQGGWVMFSGKIAEMQTGEGKTLTATLPACTAALAGVPVHVITANDYLASRDAEQMLPVYEALGLSVGVVVEGMGFDARRAAYACDVTYCTNKQVAFDYMRDRIERGTGGRLKSNLDRLGSSSEPRLMLRGLCYALIDEADSMLIDEARTPLILSRLVDGDDTPVRAYTEALEIAAVLERGRDFQLNQQERKIQLSPGGSAKAADLTADKGGVWSGERRREELIELALSARHLFHKDHEYLVRDGSVVIIDDHTGRVMADRSWQHGLHQMIEVKENCEPSPPKETLARMSYQHFFRKYLRLSGMTGTASEVAQELGHVYGLPVVHIPTNRPCRREALPDRIYLRSRDKNRAIIEGACSQNKTGRPVLIGTRSVATSEYLAHQLVMHRKKPRVLNARQDREEAEIVAGAGMQGSLTVATNMAGRGTDIHLDASAIANGGLHVMVTEWNESARVDRQLVGRCARQGDPGSYQVFAAMDDDLPGLFLPKRVYAGLAVFCADDGRLPTWLGRALLRWSQRSLESRYRQLRHRLERQDDYLGDLLAFSGSSD